MSGDTSTTPSELSRLTVPQLKALCKERRITGYSKLGKAALLEKLKPAAPGAQPVPSNASGTPSGIVHTQDAPSYLESGSTLSQSSASVTKTVPAEPNNHSHVQHWEPSSSITGSTQRTSRDLAETTIHAADSVDQITSLYASSTSEQTLGFNPRGIPPPSAPASPSDLLPPPSGVPRDLAPTSRGSTKRPISTSNVSERTTPSVPALKKQKTAPRAAPSIATKSTSSLVAPLPLSNGFRIPAVPKPKLQLAPFLIVSSTSNTAKSIAQLDQAKSNAASLASLPCTTPKRFKPLVVSKLNRVKAPTSSNAPDTASNHTISVQKRPLPLNLDQSGTPQHGNVLLYYLELRTTQDLTKSLTPITRPPSLSQRKLVNRWAIILSGLSDEERRTCAQVSRTFRYAGTVTITFILNIWSHHTFILVYLSAGIILSRHDYAGRRFDQVKQRYPAPTINMWPYLLLRETEVQIRRASFRSSFLGSFYRSYEPISTRLWSSPDHERQLVISLRYVFASFNLERFC